MEESTPSKPEDGVKSSQVAIVLSGLFPGVGHFYVGQMGKGAAFFIVSIILEANLLPEGWWPLGRDIFRGEGELTINLYLSILGLVLFRVWAVLDAEKAVRPKNPEKGFKKNPKMVKKK